MPPRHPPQAPKAARKRLDPEKREEVAQTLLYTVGSAVLIAGLVLLIALLLPLSTSVLVYSFALGVCVVSLVFILMGRSSRAGVVILTVAAGLGLASATAAWELIEVPPAASLVMATLVAAVAAVAGRLGKAPSMLVWVAWLAAAVDVAAPDAFTSVLVGACALLAMLGRGWPRHRLAVALAMAFSGLQGATTPDPVWVVIWMVSTVVLALWLVHFQRAAPEELGGRGLGRAAWIAPTRHQVGAQPWELELILLPAAWVVSFMVPELPAWAPLLVAAIILVAGLALPEPPDAVSPQGPLRDALAIVGAGALSVTLLVGGIDPVAEPLVLIVLAIVAQVVPVVRSPFGWVFRAIPALFALIAGRDAVVAVWGGVSGLVSDPVTILQGFLLTVLGVTLMMFRHGRINQVLDGVRFIAGLYLSVHGVVLAASLIGLQAGNPDGGFLVGHALASLGWMGFAAFLALRRGSTADLTLAVVVALGAVAKLVLFDMANLSGVVRASAFLGCGVIMVLIAFLRQRRRSADDPGQGEGRGAPPIHAPAPWEPNRFNGQ